MLTGLPGSGKTSFYRAQFAETHVHVSKDLMPNARNRNARQLALVTAALAAGRSVVVDNINPRPEDRAPLLAAARAQGARALAYVLETPVREALARNRSREGRARVPDVAIFIAAKCLRAPTTEEGFDDVFRVRAAGGSFEVRPGT